MHQFTDENTKLLETIAHEAAQKASVSLSKLIGVPVTIEAPIVRIIPVAHLTKLVGEPEEMVSAVIMRAEDGVEGTVLLIFPQPIASNLANFLTKRTLPAATPLDEHGISAIKECANIIAGTFFAALSRHTGVNMVESVPEFITERLEAVIDRTAYAFAGINVKETVAFEVDFVMLAEAQGKKIIQLYLTLLLNMSSAAKVLEGVKLAS